MSAAENTAAELRETVTSAREWLLTLDESTIRHRPTPDRWSIAEVVGHLIDSACNNHQRFIRAQEVEHLEFPKYEQRSWAEKSDHHASPWKELVELFYLYNLHLAQVIGNIPEDKLLRPCTVTPGEPGTLESVVTGYFDHLKHHLDKLRDERVRLSNFQDAPV